MEEAFLAVMGQANQAFGQRPDGFPSFACFAISGAGSHTLAGADGLFRGRVQVDCFGTSYGQAKVASRAVIAAVDGHIGNGFLGIWHQSTRDGRESADTGAIFRVSLDFTVVYRTTEA